MSDHVIYYLSNKEGTSKGQRRKNEKRNKEEKEKVQELEVANEVLALEYGRENARMAMAQARLEEVKQEAQDAKASYAKDFTECHRYIGLSTKFPSNLKAPSPLDPSEEEQFPRDRFAAAEEAMQAAMRELYEKTEEEKRIAAALRAATAKFKSPSTKRRRFRFGRSRLITTAPLQLERAWRLRTTSTKKPPSGAPLSVPPPRVVCRHRRSWEERIRCSKRVQRPERKRSATTTTIRRPTG